jgi:hypothetical protein
MTPEEKEKLHQDGMARVAEYIRGLTDEGMEGGTARFSELKALCARCGVSKAKGLHAIVETCGDYRTQGGKKSAYCVLTPEGEEWLDRQTGGN